MTTYVIDSWPILEWLKDKAPAAERFQRFIENHFASGDHLIMSRINYGEIVYSLAKPIPTNRIDTLLKNMQSLPITLISVDDHLVDEAAALKSRFSISYADCFAAALAIRFKGIVVTGDREFFALQEAGLLEVEWLGA